jgi:hypothetical protein
MIYGIVDAHFIEQVSYFNDSVDCAPLQIIYYLSSYDYGAKHPYGHQKFGSRSRTPNYIQEG